MKTDREIYLAPDIVIFEVMTEQNFAQSNIAIDDWGEEIYGVW